MRLLSSAIIASAPPMAVAAVTRAQVVPGTKCPWPGVLGNADDLTTLASMPGRLQRILSFATFS